ncbi:MgtC/SapB transporter [Halobacteriales archaeon SW_7_68_16]|nr:MAG: MgtC/SapB transporter [Halobacteriales archaeon SW_7_68_16]
MIAQTVGTDGVVAALEGDVVRIALATALGLFLGLEREWSEKAAGIRTFALISLLAAVFTVLADESGIGPSLLVLGGALVIVQGILLAVRGLVENGEDGSLSLTTSVSMLVAYSVGALVASGYTLAGVTVAVLSSLLLVLKRELHGLAWGLSREELRSATEFAILAFVIYPLLPADPVGVPGVDGVTVEPRVAWLMVVTVAGIGIVNYAVVANYGGRGIAVTGFLGGLASSTAVVGTMLDHVRQHPEASAYAVAAVLLANAAMAARNLVIAIAFTVEAGVLTGAVVPLGTVVLGSVLVAAVTAEWTESVEMTLESPFSMRNALGFGALFTVVIVAGAVAQAYAGEVGFLATAALTGLVSSAGATTSAVVLYRTGALGAETAVVAILIATGTSIAVKAGLAGIGSRREFARSVTVWSLALLVGAAVTTAIASAV